ncbi:hypothetical protein [Nostoc sp.]
MYSLVFIKDLLTIIGGVLGAVAFVWKVRDTSSSYIYIDLEVGNSVNEYCLIKATVENKGFSKKRIDNALLLLGPEDEPPIDTYSNLTGKKFISTNQIAHSPVKKPIYGGRPGRAVIPLPFFYEENVRIADEKASYTVPVKLDSFERGVPYAVSLFVVGENRLHRSTQDVLLIEKSHENPS